MEFSKFLNILKRHRFGIILIPILVMGVTFMLVKSLPNVYVSKARLSAGITDESQKLLNDKDEQESKINQTFSNLIQTIQLKIIYDQLSYKLILQELTAKVPMRKPSHLFNDLTPSARQHAIEVYTRMYTSRQALSLFDPDQEGLNRVLISMGYDYESLRKKIKIYRVENSDFIDIEYESEDPLLSAFVVNTLANEFINYYNSFTHENEIKAIDYLSGLLARKKDSLNMKMENLKNYKIQKRVLNLNEQAKSLYGQIADYESKLDLAQKDVEANEGAIRSINAKFNENDKEYIEGKLEFVNRDILKLQSQLNALNDEYIRKNFDPSIKQQIDALKNELNLKIAQSTDKYVTSPLTAKDNLVAQKLRLEVDLSLAKNSIITLKAAIASLNQRLNMLVPNEAVIQAYESDINVAGQEYIEILKKYNQTSMELSSAVRVRLVEAGLPGVKQPSKKIILVALSGIVSFVIYLVILFILFYLDESIKVPVDLVARTDAPVLGHLPVIKSSFLDIQKMWNVEPVSPFNREFKKLVHAAGTDIQKFRGRNGTSEANSEFKKLIRATRFEINMALMGGRNLVISSMDCEEGKTLLALSLVSAYQMMNKKVLLIDGNFISPGITEITQPKNFIEDYLVGNISLYQLIEDGNISVLGNYGNDISLFEINTESAIEQKLLELKDIFDIIIIEASGLTSLNQSKEWIVVADRVLCVYEANTSITNAMKEQILYLKSLEGKFIGWVLNKVTQ